MFQGRLNDLVVLAGGVGIADGVAQGVGGEVGALGQEEEAAAEGEAALVIRPQACEGAQQGGFADAASAFEQYPFGGVGFEVDVGEQWAAGLGVDGEVLQDEDTALAVVV